MSDSHDAIVVTGMVLTAMPIGEYDKRITLLTRERGKITVFARGARRPNSQHLAATNPFCFGEFELIQGRSAYTLTKTSIRNYFRELTMDPVAAYTGFYFLEFASYFCQENNDETEMLKLLYQSFRALQSPKFRKDLVRGIFEMKAMVIGGEGLNLFSCTSCGKKASQLARPLSYLSLSRGGMICEECSTRFTGFPISGTALYTMQYISSTPVEKLYSFALNDETREEFLHIVSQYIHMYVHHTFKSLEVLDGLAIIL